MNKYSLKCTCGHVVTVDSENMDSAKKLLLEMLLKPGAIEEHMKMYHQPNEPVPTEDQVRMMVDMNTVEGVLPEEAPMAA